MKKHRRDFQYQERFEYHGNTQIERIRHRADQAVLREWLLFDTADEALEYFNNHCSEPHIPHLPAWMIHEAASSRAS